MLQIMIIHLHFTILRDNKDILYLWMLEEHNCLKGQIPSI